MIIIFFDPIDILQSSSSLILFFHKGLQCFSAQVQRDEAEAHILSNIVLKIKPFF